MFDRDNSTVYDVMTFIAKVNVFKLDTLKCLVKGEITEEQYYNNIADMDIYMAMANERLEDLRNECELNSLESQTPEC
jgi:hypothetical protein